MANIVTNIYVFKGHKHEIDVLHRLLVGDRTDLREQHHQQWLFTGSLSIKEEMTDVFRTDDTTLVVNTESRNTEDSEGWKDLLEKNQLDIQMSWQTFEPNWRIFYRVDPNGLMSDIEDTFVWFGKPELDQDPWHVWKNWMQQAAEKYSCAPTKEDVTQAIEKCGGWVLFCQHLDA